MSVNRWKLVAMPVVVMGLASPLLANCGGGIPGAGNLPGGVGDLADAAGGCDEMKSGDFASIQMKGDAKANAKVKGFLEAAFALDKVSAEMEAELIAACREIAKPLGASDDELKGEAGGGEGAQKVCGVAKAKLDVAIKASAEAKLAIEFQEPKCYVDVEAMQKCFAECDVAVQPGELKASCQGGEIAGKCDAECKGSCTVDASAQCTGSCNATCSGACEANFSGKCGGNCDGRCDGKNAKGKCAGTCEGKCDAQAEGSCGGSCNGKCSGSCEIKGGAKCEGTCSGGCSVEMKAPKCSGEFRPPKVDATCQTNCGAKGAASAKCDPPGLKIVAKGKANAETPKLIAALQAGLPGVLKVQLGLSKKVIDAANNVKGAGAAMGDAALSAGGKAAACVKAAVDATVSATASVNVSVKASASVSGSAKAGGG